MATPVEGAAVTLHDLERAIAAQLGNKRARAEAMDVTGASSATRTTRLLELGIPHSAHVNALAYAFFRVLWPASWHHSLSVTVRCITGDVDLFVSRDNCRPTADTATWRGNGKVVVVSPDDPGTGKGFFYIGVVGRRPSQFVVVANRVEFRGHRPPVAFRTVRDKVRHTLEQLRANDEARDKLDQKVQAICRERTARRKRRRRMQVDHRQMGPTFVVRSYRQKMNPIPTVVDGICTTLTHGPPAVHSIVRFAHTPRSDATPFIDDKQKPHARQRSLSTPGSGQRTPRSAPATARERNDHKEMRLAAVADIGTELQDDVDTHSSRMSRRRSSTRNKFLTTMRTRFDCLGGGELLEPIIIGKTSRCPTRNHALS
ncbi:unnamed protein product (mitochondrion) [Plasmodiophora brassicae]|uniref:Uncharacterized protein n=1 Tax=Plasmodiophora brassicae TaxID=37360 RepID=A0A3P3YGT9_PLABS|nr:unnamed protein product [Plasmodiophora brassicae]